MRKDKNTKTLKKPVFAVITVTLNNIEGLKKTFESIQKQEHKDFEWLIIDGGSNDGSKEFLVKQKNENTHNFFIRYTSEKDNGIYDAMNKGIKYAYGDYIIFMNAGDQFAKTDTLKTLATLTKKQPDFIYGDALETTKNDRKPITKTSSHHTKLPWGMFTHHQAMVYRNARIKELNIRYSHLYTIASDYDFTAQYLKNTKRILYTHKPICIFEHGGISQQNATKGRREQFIIREKLEMVSTTENLVILMAQALSWTLKSHTPRLHRALRALLIKKQ